MVRLEAEVYVKMILSHSRGGCIHLRYESGYKLGGEKISFDCHELLSLLMVWLRKLTLYTEETFITETLNGSCCLIQFSSFLSRFPASIRP